MRGVADLCLRTNQPLGHGFLLDQEGTRDLSGREPRQGAKGECHLRLEGECRVAAGEQEAKAIIGDAAFFSGGLVPVGVGHRELLVLLALGRTPPKAIDRPVARDRS